MEEKLLELWFNKKEVEVFLYLIEFWISSASEVAKKLNYPKSSVNFLADNLWKKWILKKSFRWKTGYYEVDISSFEKNLLDDLDNKKNILEDIIPKLKEKNKNTFERPKIIFIDWLENCKKAYLNLLNAKNIFYEIGAHWELENAFWKWFMQDFIKKRIKNNVICDAITNNWEIDKQFRWKDDTEKRKIRFFDEEIFWKIYSSLAIYDNKVLILNLNWKNSWVLIENKDFYKTMKTIFMIAKK